MRFRIGTMLLQFKHTMMFVIFGLFVGYSSYVVTTFSNTKMLVDQFLNTDHNIISGISDEYGNDWMLGLSTVSRENDNARDLLKALIPSEFKDSIIINFYYKNTGDNLWYLLRNSSKPRQNPERTTGEITEELENALKLNIVDAEHHFFKLNSSRLIFINATRPGDSHKYVLRININRENLIQFILRSKNNWLVYTFVTLLISLVLGFIFAKSISIPMRKLSDGAIALSRGDLDVHFKMKRKDDIGVLSGSLNEMAVNIKNRIRTIETMNKIDKAVNSSISRKQLLENVAGYIADMFEGSAVFIFEKETKDYRVLAHAPKKYKLKKDKIPFTSISERYYRNDRRTYFFTDESLVHIHSLAEISDKFTKGISIPLIQSDRLVGLLVVLIDHLDKLKISSLESLADQVSVALLSLKESDDKNKMYDGMLLSLSRSIDTKSRWTAGHSERVTKHAVALAEKIGLDRETMEKIRIAALLHDIGKLGVSEAILNKPEKLADEEFAIIRNHPAMGEDIIKDIPHFTMVKSVVRYHHEKWDGTGYPDGLSKDSIPFAARIVAIADVWDAITADRPYRKGFTREKALEIMKSERGKLFDPGLLDVFMQDQ